MKRLIRVVLCFLAFARCALVQEFRASLLVEVHDSSGATIPFAKTVLLDETSGSTLSKSVDALGGARFQGIAPAGLRYDTTFGLFIASGRNQAQNPALSTLQAL